MPKPKTRSHPTQLDRPSPSRPRWTWTTNHIKDSFFKTTRSWHLRAGKDFKNHLDQGSHTQIPSVLPRSWIIRDWSQLGTLCSVWREHCYSAPASCCHRPGTATGSEYSGEAGTSGVYTWARTGTPAGQIQLKCDQLTYSEPDRAGGPTCKCQTPGDQSSRTGVTKPSGREAARDPGTHHS